MLWIESEQRSAADTKPQKLSEVLGVSTDKLLKDRGEKTKGAHA